MPVINSNISSQYAQDAIKTNAKVQSTTMQQLSTGSRINAAKDDAAGLSISQNMTSQVRGLNQAVRNVNDGINQLQTADGAMIETSNMLQRMRELAVQASNATNSASQRNYLNNEFTSLKVEITRIADNTTWNNTRLIGQKAMYAFSEKNAAASTLLDATIAYSAANAASAGALSANGTWNPAAFSAATMGMQTASAAYLVAAAAASAQAALGLSIGNETPAVPQVFTFQAGINAGQTIQISIPTLDASGLLVDQAQVATFSGAQAAIGLLDTAIEKVNGARSMMGATMNQLNYSGDNMINISTNIAASRSTIMDTDYATASAQLAKTQIISQAATAMLAQANQQPQSVLALLKG